jgi:hypothetical protein
MYTADPGHLPYGPYTSALHCVIRNYCEITEVWGAVEVSAGLSAGN